MMATDESQFAPFACDYAANDDADEAAQVAREIEAIAEAGVTAKTLGEHVAELAKAGALERIPTGIPTLDNAMRGGLPLRRFVIIGGAPGTFKTSVVCWRAYGWAKAGVVVGIMAVDEGPEGYVDRCALYESAKRDLLDAGDTREWARLGTALQNLPIIIDDGAMTVEAFAAHVRRIAGDRPAVLIADSLQTVRAESKDARASDGKREQIDRVVRALKRSSVAHNLLVIATCELSRAYYRSEALARELNPLAAFKESGSIEYQSQTAIVLTTPKGHHDLIDVTVAKNRGYRKESFRLQLHEDLSFHETDRPSDDEEELTQISKPLEKAKGEIVALLRREHDLRSKTEIYRRIHGTQSVRVNALKEQVERGVVVELAGVFRLAPGVGQ